MGGKKRKIEIEKLEEKTKKSVTFAKRRKGLFSKASELCHLSPGTQIAILATPPSSNSHASFYTFGHSSVDDVVSSFLYDHPPLSTRNQENMPGLGFWWEDEGFFDRLDNVDELKEAADAVTRMLIRLDAVRRIDPRDKGKGVQIQQQEEDLQVRNTKTNNNNEETTTRQIPSVEATASGSKSFLENEEDTTKKSVYCIN